LGGGILGNGEGRVSSKVLKIPSKRGPEALRTILTDFEANVTSGETFLNYFDRQGEKYFYELLIHLSDTTNLVESDFIDWGAEEKYEMAVGVGECAGVVIDLVATLLFESEEKTVLAAEALKLNQFSDSIYYSYTSIVNTAKALLLAEGEKTNTQAGIISQFDALFAEKIQLETSFSEFVYQIQHNEPTKEFTQKYVADAQLFYAKANEYRMNEVAE
ncbi:MAG: HEPN domain-containing protein, partial [Lutibacter sp.]|nr:HEPN domain-containing protein [Lutibacter sp.]